jgi:hypothetical protein
MEYPFKTVDVCKRMKAKGYKPLAFKVRGSEIGFVHHLKFAVHRNISNLH